MSEQQQRIIRLLDEATELFGAMVREHLAFASEAERRFAVSNFCGHAHDLSNAVMTLPLLKGMAQAFAAGRRDGMERPRADA